MTVPTKPVAASALAHRKVDIVSPKNLNGNQDQKFDPVVFDANI